MNGNTVFNLTVCIMGIAILLIHVVNLLLKANKRKDEKALFAFLSFTVLHFAVYIIFTVVKEGYTSDPFVISFYTLFYIFNNLEAFLLFLYVLSYVEIEPNAKRWLGLINLTLFLVFVSLDFINVFTGFFFTSIGGVYTRNRLMFLSQGYQFAMFVVVFLVAVLNKKLVLREKIAFALYCILPGASIVLQNIFKGYAIAYATIIVSIEILFFFINVAKNILLAEEKERNKEAQIRIMMSQIRPHFVYNSLSAISTLIPLDPKKAQKALDDFTEYLRHNISALTETRLIPFEDELRHIKTYAALEKLRFKDRVKVIYDIGVKDFYLPPLSIQPIAENAIKHGILKKIEGGTLKIKTYDRGDAIVVEVEDDGVGFNKEDVNFAENKHFGMMNIEHRLKTMCHGELLIDSKPNVGTKAKIIFYKDGGKR